MLHHLFDRKLTLLEYSFYITKLFHVNRSRLRVDEDMPGSGGYWRRVCVWVEAWLQTTIVPSMPLSQLMIALCVVLYSTILLRSRLNDELL